MSTTAMATRLGRELIAICGMEHVTEAPPERIFGCAPAVAARPGSAEEIAAVLRVANESGLAVVAAGGCTQQQTGKPPTQVDILLYTTRLTAVEHYDPGDLTVGIGAGCRVGQLTSMLAKDGLLFAADPPLPERATVGGVLATGMTGPLRQGYGGLRDYCIGIKFVTGDGRQGKGGGRVVKNVAGYDMMKLLIGSQGTLAIITGASFKLFPAPRETRTFITEFPSADEAMDFRNRVLRSPLSPLCLELLSPEASFLVPSDKRSQTAWSVYVRAAGSPAVVARYRAELGGAISREVEGQSEHDVWRAIEHLSHILMEQSPESLLLSFSTPLSDVLPILHELTMVAESNGLKLATFGRVGVGHMLAALMPPPGSKADFAAALSGLRLPREASMWVLQCPRTAQTEMGGLRTPTHGESMRAVKRALDANDILNRGRFLL